jgi:hypothetical protein
LLAVEMITSPGLGLYASQRRLSRCWLR